MPTYRSRYDIGDTVWGVSIRPAQYRERCVVCNGSGRAKIEGHPHLTTGCPVRECYDGYISIAAGKQFELRQLTIGSIRIEVNLPMLVSETVTVSECRRSEVKYMCRETGVGSGRLWDEENLFRSREEAEAIARRRGAVRVDELELPSDATT